MLSHKLIQCIQDHSEQITGAIIDRIRHDPELARIGRLPASELRQWGHALLKNLGAWLAGDDREVMARHYETLGKTRHEEDIPLHECVRSLHILKYEIVDYGRNQGFPQSSIEIYAEEEFEHRVDRFIDFLVYHLVRGYEGAMKTAREHGKPAAAARA